MYVVSPGLGDDVYDPARCASKLGARAAGDNLEFLDRVQRDVDRCSLASELLAKEAVVVVTAIEANVIENASLAAKVDFVPVRPLRDGHAGRKGKQVLKFASKNWCPANG